MEGLRLLLRVVGMLRRVRLLLLIRATKRGYFKFLMNQVAAFRSG